MISEVLKILCVAALISISIPEIIHRMGIFKQAVPTIYWSVLTLLLALCCFDIFKKKEK